MRRMTIALAAFALLAAACGQYPGVHERAVESGQVAPAGTSGLTSDPGAIPPDGTVPGTGDAGATGTTGATGTGITGTGATGTGTTGGTGTGGTTTGGTGSDGTSGAPAGGGTTTGVTAKTIKIGIHAPLTGAAPLKAESFDKGKELYWLKGNNGKPVQIHGRTVQVVFQDDQYNPSHARAVCQQMAQEQEVFLLVGGGGTDQIQACAQYSASEGIPYLSAGVTEKGMSTLPNYFGISMSYPDQAPLLVKYMKANAGALGWSGDPSQVAVVVTNTPNFDDAVQAFTGALPIPSANVFRPEKNERGSSMAGQLCTGTLKNFEVVFPLAAPTYFLEMAGAAKCNPRYVGVGISMGLDQVAATGCRTGGVADSRFLSPAPAFADSNKYDPAFRAAGGSDDIMFLLWGLSKTLHQLLDKAGPNLTREGFIASSSSASVKSGVYPDLRFTPQNRYGASQAHVLRADCGRGAYVTERAFYS